MDKENYLRTIRVNPIDYPTFIRLRNNKNEQISAILNMIELQGHYIKHNIMAPAYSEPNIFSRDFEVDWAFELYRMKKAIIHNRDYTINKNVRPSLTKFANQVFLLSMIYAHVDIVSYFLKSRIINVNQSIFGSKHWPSYFLLACSCDQKVFNEFKSYWTNQNISWSGLTPSILCYLSRNNLNRFDDLDFLSYQQFQLINEFRGIKLKNSDEPLPIFILDFACMLSDRMKIKKILDENPEIGQLSRLSFIVQNEEHLILILSRYGFRNSQNFNGNTPLHYSCYNDNLCTLSLLLYIDFPIRQDNKNKFPNEVGSHKTREKASIFLNLCAGLPSRNNHNERYFRVFSVSLFQESISKWMHILRYKPEENDKYIGIFRYLDFNKDHKVTKKSRFNIINAFTLSKTPVSVENCIQKLLICPFYFRTYTVSEISKFYSRYCGE